MTRFLFSMLFAILCMNSQSIESCLAQDQDDKKFTAKLTIEKELQEFEIESLNEYIGLFVGDGCEVLYAEKAAGMLILVFEASDGRVIANTTGISRDRVSWRWNNRQVKQPPSFGISTLEITYPTVVYGSNAWATSALPQGMVFFPLMQRQDRKLALTLFLDGKEHRRIVCNLRSKAKLQVAEIPNDEGE